MGHTVGLFKVGHARCLENDGLCHGLGCVGHAWAFLDGFWSQWWWVVMDVVGWFVAVGMGSDWVVGCCGGCGLLIRPWVAYGGWDGSVWQCWWCGSWVGVGFVVRGSVGMGWCGM